MDEIIDMRNFRNTDPAELHMLSAKNKCLFQIIYVNITVHPTISLSVCPEIFREKSHNGFIEGTAP